MKFDWLDPSFNLKKTPPNEIEEAFEDPFCLKILPDIEVENSLNARYFLIGRSLRNNSYFICFWTNGKQYRVIAARPCTESEIRIYERMRQTRL